MKYLILSLFLVASVANAASVDKLNPELVIEEPMDSVSHLMSELADSESVVLRQIYVEVTDILTETEAITKDSQKSSGWLSGLMASWREHLLSVQVRQVEMLVRSAVRRDLIDETDEESLLGLIRQSTSLERE